MCADFVRVHDYERYVLTLFAPRKQRAPLFALFALNVELKRIGTTVNEPMMRRIRLQWWRDAVGGVFGGEVLHHHVLRGIAAGVTNGVTWTETHFHALIDGHEQTALRDTPRDAAQLWADADATGNALDKLLQDVTGDTTPPQSAALDMLLALPDLPRHWVHGKIATADDVPEPGRNRLSVAALVDQMRPLVTGILIEIDRRVAQDKPKGFAGTHATLIRYLRHLLHRQDNDVFAFKTRYTPQTLGFTIALRGLLGR